MPFCRKQSGVAERREGIVLRKLFVLGVFASLFLLGSVAHAATVPSRWHVTQAGLSVLIPKNWPVYQSFASYRDSSLASGHFSRLISPLSGGRSPILVVEAPLDSDDVADERLLSQKAHLGLVFKLVPPFDRTMPLRQWKEELPRLLDLVEKRGKWSREKVAEGDIINALGTVGYYEATKLGSQYVLQAIYSKDFSREAFYFIGIAFTPSNLGVLLAIARSMR